MVEMVNTGSVISKSRVYINHEEITCELEICGTLKIKEENHGKFEANGCCLAE
jgi:hypothetical protein